MMTEPGWIAIAIFGDSYLGGMAARITSLFFKRDEQNWLSRVKCAEPNQKVLESIMSKLLFGLVAVVALGIAAPASAQVFIGGDSGGAGVQVGPLGIGVGPRYSDDGYYNRKGYDANAYYAGDCRLVRSRVVTPSGHVVFRTRRICD